MQDPPNTTHPPIGGCFVVDLARPLPGAGGGLPAFGAADLRSGRTDLMAVAAARLYRATNNVTYLNKAILTANAILAERRWLLFFSIKIFLVDKMMMK